MRDYLQTARVNAGYTYASIAKKLGLSREYYRLIEAGERQKTMDLALLSNIADLLRLNLNDCVSEELAYQRSVEAADKPTEESEG